MTTNIRSNSDGSSDILNGVTVAAYIDSTGNVWIVVENFADDTAASAGGVPIGGLYRTGATVKCRVV